MSQAKTDLSLVPWEDIAAELRRRYPSGALAILYQPDGKPPGLQALSMTWGGPIPALGLLDYAREATLTDVMGTNKRQQPPGPLDQY